MNVLDAGSQLLRKQKAEMSYKEEERVMLRLGHGMRAAKGLGAATLPGVGMRKEELSLQSFRPFLTML